MLVRVPVALSDAALVNAVVTATEAKTQALLEAGVPGSGTSSDAVCIACPAPGALASASPVSRSPAAGSLASGQEVPVEEYGGPRSPWGARIARATHRAVAAGTADWLTLHPDGDPHRRWTPSSGG
jgi:adenosylcobinamide amidohydrolase